MADTPATPESTPVADKRDDTTDKPVTELATVDATTTVSEMKDMAGVTDSSPSEQQSHVLAGLKDAKADAAGKDRKVEANPFASGPGSDVA